MEKYVPLGKIFFFIGVYWATVMFISEKALEVGGFDLSFFFYLVLLSPLLWGAELYLMNKSRQERKQIIRRKS